jgi:hypothetical protein
MITNLEIELGEHSGFCYTTQMKMKKDEKGEWHVEQTISQSFSDDLEVWEERSTNFESRGYDLEKALAEVAVLSTLYLESIKYNLFAEIDLEEGEYLQ